MRLGAFVINNGSSSVLYKFKQIISICYIDIYISIYIYILISIYTYSDTHVAKCIYVYVYKRICLSVFASTYI